MTDYALYKSTIIIEIIRYSESFEKLEVIKSSES